MSTGLIIAIVIVVLIVLALLAFVLPRARAKAAEQKRERELQQRRDREAGRHRAEAETRERQASEAEQKARIAEKEAEAQRAQAQLHQERAGMHERGMADDELMNDSERDRFSGTSADRPAGGMSSRDVDRDGVDDRAERSGPTGRFRRDGDGVADDREATGSASARADGMDDYQRGRRDEALDER
jgi:hypothetical protein